MSDQEHSRSESVVSESDTDEKRFPYRGILSDQHVSNVDAISSNVLSFPILTHTPIIFVFS